MFPACYIRSKKDTRTFSLWTAWSIVHKQKIWVTSSSAYLTIENLIKPIPTCWNIHPVQAHICAEYLRWHVWFAMHADLLTLININGSFDYMWHSHKLSVFILLILCLLILNFLWVKPNHTSAAFCKTDHKYKNEINYKIIWFEHKKQLNHRTLLITSIKRMSMVNVYILF